MKTTIDRRFLIGLIIGVLFLAAAVEGLHAVQISRQSRFLLEEAHRAQKAGQFELAINRLRDYNKLAPDDSDAQAEFGLMLADHNASREAAVTLEKVLRAQPDRDDLRRRLASLEMSIGRSSDAKAHLERLKEKSPNDADLFALLGTCQAIGGEYAPASESLQKSIARDPHQVETYARLADVMRKLQRPKDADTWMENMVQANPKSARAHLLDGQYLAGIGSMKEARGQAEKALELAPKDANVLLLAAHLAMTSAAYDKARGYAKRAIDCAPTSAVPYMALAQIESLSGDRKKAIACLETGADKTQSRDPSLLWELGRLRIEAGDLPGAREVIDTLHKLPADDRLEPLVGYLEAQIALSDNHWQAAIQQLGQVAAELNQSPELLKQVRLQIAACYERLGNTDLQLVAYQQASAVDPAWPPARLGIASTLLALGKFDEALEEYRQIARSDGMSGAGKAGVARLLILKNLGRRPAEQDWKEVDALLDELARNDPESVGVTLLRAESLSGQRRAAEAEKLLLDARTKFPERIELWSALVGLADRQELWPRAEQLLAEADKKFGDRVWLRLAHGSYLLARQKLEAGSVERGAGLKALANNTEAFSAADRATLFRGLTALSVQAGDTTQAVVLARRAGDADPKNLEAKLFLFDLAFGNGDEPSVNQALKEIRDLEGEGPFWHYGQAALCLLAKTPTAALDDAAFRHIEAARKLRPGWTALDLLTAQIQDRQGQSGAALQDYLEAIDRGERSPRAIRRAVELLYAKQRYPEADQLLRRLEQQPSLFSGDIERMASKVSARLDDLDRALVLARKVATDSSNWQDQVWLGQLQSLLGLQAQRAGRTAEASGRFVDAEKSLRDAVRLKPDVADPWVALIRFFAAIDRKPDAETVIHQAERRLTAETTALALASCYEAIGNTGQASKQYQQALSRSANDPLVVRRVAEFEARSGKLADAEAHLRKIVSGQVSAKADEVASARRELAAVLRASGSYPKIEQALALIEQNLAAGAAPEDLREKAFALALCPQPERRREAMKLLEGLLPAQPDADDARIALYQLYLAERDWPKAAQLLRELITSHEREPSYITIYASQLLKRQETDEAELWIHRLEAIAPNDFATAGLKAEALLQRGKTDAAIQAFRDLLARVKLSADEAAGQTRFVAARLEELAARMNTAMTGPDQSAAAAKLLSEAESLYRKYAQMKPDQQLALATFLARRGRSDEATSLVESAQPTADPNALAQACVELMGSESSGGQPDNRIEKILLAAIKQHGDAAVLQICLADFRLRQERFDDAAAIYREVLEKDPASLVAMNNLAVLLAAEKKDLDEARRLAQQAIAAAGPMPALLDSRATVYLALGKPTEALADLEQAIGAEPRPNRQFHRALAYFQLGQPEAAAKALGEARKLGFKPDQLGALERRDYQQLAAKLGG